jgi:hypothetical protein
MSSEEASIKLQPLTASNYFRWAVDIECALDMRDLWCAVEDDEEYKALSTDPERTRKSRKAKSFILFHISPNIRDSFLVSKTAKELWTTVKDRFKQTSNDRNAALHMSLISAKQRGGEKMAEFISRLEGHVRELRDRCGEKVSDGMLAGILMSGVLPKYAETISALRCLDTLKVETLKQTLIAAEDRMSTDSEGVRDKPRQQGRAFHTKGETRCESKAPHWLRCHRCGQRDHFARQCPQKENAGSANVAQSKRVIFVPMSHSADSAVQAGARSAQDILVDTGASHHIVNDSVNDTL